MNKTELITKTKENIDIEISKKDLDTILEGLFKTIKEIVASGDKVAIAGFGTFEVTERAARTGRNPKTGESIDIPASKAPKFKAAKAFKDMVNA